jgi:hypothetical protein
MKPIVIPKTTQAQLPEQTKGILLFEKLKKFLESVRSKDTHLKKHFEKTAELTRDPDCNLYVSIESKKNAPDICFGIVLANKNSIPDFSLFVESWVSARVKLPMKSSRYFKMTQADGRTYFQFKSKCVVNRFGKDEAWMLDWFGHRIKEAENLLKLR